VQFIAMAVTVLDIRGVPGHRRERIEAAELAFFTFDDSGQVTSTHVLGRDARGVDIQPGIWHTTAVLSEHVVCFEVNPGPYSAANDKDFAPWAPREGEAAAVVYLEGLVGRLSAGC
jgi:hypothetical protein